MDLEFRERPPAPDSEVNPPCLVLLHGYGSNELDLLGLASALSPVLHVISVRGPHQLGPQAYAWFDLEWDSTGPIANQEQAVEAQAQLTTFLKDLPNKLGYTPHLTLAGFSQGAMMTLGAALADPAVVQRMAMLSGRVLPAFVPRHVDRRLEGHDALVQHGLQDQVISFHGSREAAAVLDEFGANVRHLEYHMGHEVGYESLQDFRTWLAEEAKPPS